jgi:excisionase family DNA binding protein
MGAPTAEWVSVSTAARHFGVSRQTIYKWIAGRRVRGKQIAGRWVVRVWICLSTHQEGRARARRGA